MHWYGLPVRRERTMVVCFFRLAETCRTGIKLYEAQGVERSGPLIPLGSSRSFGYTLEGRHDW